jgi:hypothetical protein
MGLDRIELQGAQSRPAGCRDVLSTPDNLGEQFFAIWQKTEHRRKTRHAAEGEKPCTCTTGALNR